MNKRLTKLTIKELDKYQLIGLIHVLMAERQNLTINIEDLQELKDEKGLVIIDKLPTSYYFKYVKVETKVYNTYNPDLQ